MTEFKTLVRSGVDTIDFEGVPVRILRGQLIEPGDTYMAGRNTGPHLLTAKVVDTDNWWILPVEPAYPFDLHQCVKVEILI